MVEDYLEDSEHNICGIHNDNNTDCSSNGGPKNVKVFLPQLDPG